MDALKAFRPAIEDAPALAKGLADPDSEASTEAKGFAVLTSEGALVALLRSTEGITEEEEEAKGEVKFPNEEKGFTKAFAGVEELIEVDIGAKEVGRPKLACTAFVVVVDAVETGLDMGVGVGDTDRVSAGVGGGGCVP